MMSFYVEQICVPTALSTKARCEKDGGLSPTESYYRIHCTISVLRCLKIHTPLPFTFMTALSFSKTNTEMIWMKPSARHIQIDLFRKEISKDASLWFAFVLFCGVTMKNSTWLNYTLTRLIRKRLVVLLEFPSYLQLLRILLGLKWATFEIRGCDYFSKGFLNTKNEVDGKTFHQHSSCLIGDLDSCSTHALVTCMTWLLWIPHNSKKLWKHFPQFVRRKYTLKTASNYVGNTKNQNIQKEENDQPE